MAPLPRVAIVGRPNVGKSSLLNMLAARKVSIVDDTPGTTRDRVSTLVTLESRDDRQPPIMVELTDTGGYGVYTVEGRRIDEAGKDLAALTHDIESQIRHAVESADLVLFVLDTQVGITAQDREVARLLREGGLGPRDEQGPAGRPPRGKGAAGAGQPGPRVVVVANKCDGPRWEADALEAAALGFGEPLVVSAKNNFRRRELVERLYDHVRALPARVQPVAAGDTRPPELMLAIVGKRNAGKSTFVNTLAGEERVIVSEIAGTTRDAVDVRFEIDGKPFLAIDTAGLRKKKSLQDRIEWWALDRCQRAIERADVCLLLIDATTPVSQVDKHLGHFISERYKPVVIVVNKWDLAEGKPLAGDSRNRKVTQDDYVEYLRSELKGLAFAPIEFTSGKRGTGLKETIALAFEMFEQSRTRATTGKLNRLVREILERQGPASKIGAFAKLLFVTQTSVCPPTIVCVVNKPELFTANYQRFLLNRFRETLPYPEVPIKLLIRGRSRDQTIELEDGVLARVRGGTGTGEDGAETGELVEVGGEADPGRALGAGRAGESPLSAAERDETDWSVMPIDEAKFFDVPAEGEEEGDAPAKPRRATAAAPGPARAGVTRGRKGGAGGKPRAPRAGDPGARGRGGRGTDRHGGGGGRDRGIGAGGSAPRGGSSTRDSKPTRKSGGASDSGPGGPRGRRGSGGNGGKGGQSGGRGRGGPGQGGGRGRR